MRELKEIEKTSGLKIIQFNPDEGMNGYYEAVEYSKSGSLKLGQRYTFVFTWNNGWEHLSISITNSLRTPTWDEMCMFKDMFFKEDEACVEYHPKKEDYVNLHPRMFTHMETTKPRTTITR